MVNHAEINSKNFLFSVFIIVDYMTLYYNIWLTHTLQIKRVLGSDSLDQTILIPKCDQSLCSVLYNLAQSRAVRQEICTRGTLSLGEGGSGVRDMASPSLGSLGA